MLVPPSQVGGRAYEVIDDRPPTGAVLDWDAAVRLLKPPRPAPVHRAGAHSGGGVAHLPGWMAEQPEGNRNSALFWAACRAAEAGDQDVLGELVDAAVSTGLDESSARATVASACRRVADDAR